MGIIDQGIDLLSSFGTHVFQAKTAVERSASFSNDALHLISGLLLVLLGAFVLRSSLPSFRPWLLVLGLAVANELNDLHVRGWPGRSTQLGEGVVDIILLLLLPTLLLIVARTRPHLLVRR